MRLKGKEKVSYINRGDKVALVALSNALGNSMKVKIEALCSTLREMGLEIVCSAYLYEAGCVRGGLAKQKARELESYYEDEEIKAIFDISGGDIANEVLCELDFDKIADHHKAYWGYSDLTTIVNAIYQKTGQEAYLYQIRNLIGECFKEQQSNFRTSILSENKDRSLFDFEYGFIQGTHMEGIVIGGNIRCFLKLAGTPFMPDFKDKILFLESRSGGVAQMITFLSQYKQLGAFNQVKGILLGSFTQMEQEKLVPSIESLVMEIVGDKELPIAKTKEIGHGQNSKAIIIGKSLKLCQ